MNAPKLSVCFPAYNEGKNIAKTLLEAVFELKKIGRPFEVIVVNDGSKDNTELEIKKLIESHPQIKLINHPYNQGYAMATKNCLKYALGDIIFIIDSDGQQTSKDIPKFLEKMNQGYDAVVGYKKPRNDPFSRVFLSWGYNLIFRILFSNKLHDVDCGFRCFTKEVAQKIKISHTNVPVGPEMFAQLLKMNFKIAEVIVTHFPRKSGTPTFVALNLPKHVLRIAWSLIKLKIEMAKNR